MGAAVCPWLALTAVLVALVYLPEVECVADPVMVLPKLANLPRLGAKGERTELGAGTPPTLMEQRNQCRKILDLWRSEHADYAVYKHAKAMFDKLSLETREGSAGFEDMDALYRGLSQVAEHWTSSPSGQVFAAASQRCEDTATVSYKVFLPQEADQAAQLKSRQKAECAAMTRSLQDQLDALLTVISEGLRQAREDHELVQQAVKSVEQEWTSKRSSIALDRAVEQAATKQAELEEGTRKLDKQLADEESSERRRALHELGVFLQEQVEWQKREVDRLNGEKALVALQTATAERKREAADSALERRLELNQTVTDDTKSLWGQIGALKRVGASKGGLNEQDTLQMSGMVNELQGIRIGLWRSFRDEERAVLSQDYTKDKERLEKLLKHQKGEVDKATHAFTLLESAQRSIRAQVSLLMTPGDRSVAYRRLSTLTTQAEASRLMQKRAMLRHVQLQSELTETQNKLNQAQMRPKNQTLLTERVLAGMDALEADFKQNVSKYGAIEAHQGLKVLKQKREHLSTLMHLAHRQELAAEVAQAVAKKEVRSLAPGIQKLIRDLQGKLNHFMCSEPTQKNAEAQIREGRLQIEPWLSKVHAEQLSGARARVDAMKQQMEAEDEAETRRVSAQASLKELSQLEMRYNATTDKFKKSRMVRRVTLLRKSANKARLALTRAEEKVTAAEQMKAKQELESQLRTTCQIPKHLSAWNQCCNIASQRWLWAQPQYASIMNSQQLVQAAGQLTGEQDAALLTEKTAELQRAWDASGAGVAYAGVQAECNKPQHKGHDAHARVEARVERTAKDLTQALAEEKAASQELDDANAEVVSTKDSLRQAKEDDAKSLNVTVADMTTDSMAVKQWKYMLAAAKRKQSALKGAFEVASGKRIAAQEASDDAVKQLEAAQGATEILEKIAQLEPMIKRQRDTTTDVRKRAKAKKQLEEMDAQKFTIEQARSAADLGGGSSNTGVSRTELVANYVAQFQAERTMSAINGMLTQLRAMEEQAKNSKAEHAAIVEKIRLLEADLKTVQDTKFQAEAQGTQKLAAAKSAGMGAFTTKQMMVSTHSLLKRRAKAMQEVMAGTGQSSEAVAARTEAQAKLEAIDNELLRIEEMQRNLAPEASGVIGRGNQDKASKTVTLGEVQHDAPREKNVLGETSQQASARTAFQRKVSTASVKTAQMINQLEQELMQLKQAESNANTNHQKARVARDIADANMRLEEANHVADQIAVHERVLTRANKDDTIVRQGLKLQSELKELKQQLTLSAMFMQGRTLADPNTPNVTDSAGNGFQLNAVARMVASRRARDARASAKQMDTMLQAVKHALAVVPSASRMRVAAKTTQRRATAMVKILRNRLHKLRARAPAEKDTAEYAAREQQIAEVQHNLNKQIKIAQSAKNAIENSERALGSQAHTEQKHGPGCAQLSDKGAAETCKQLHQEAESRCSQLHHDMYNKCCGSIVLGWQWGRSSYQTFQSSQLLMEEGKPYWEKAISSAQKKAQLEKMQAQRAASLKARQKWEMSQDRQVSTAVEELCAVKSEADAKHLAGLEANAEHMHTLDDEDEPLSELTLNNVPAGTADGATDLTGTTQASLHKAIDESTSTLKRQLDALQKHHEDEISKAKAEKVFGHTQALMTKVRGMAKEGFVDEHSQRMRAEAARSGQEEGAEAHEEGAEQSQENAAAQQLAARQEEFARKQKELAVQKEMEASARNADLVEQVCNHLSLTS